MILPHSEGGVVKQAWGSGEAERWNDLTPFQHTMQRFDPTSVWCAAPAEAPLLLCNSLLSVFLSLRTQMSQTKALNKGRYSSLTRATKGNAIPSGGVPLWSHSQQHYRHLALYLLNHVFIWPKMPWGVIKFGQLVLNNNYLFVPFNFPSRVEHKEKRRTFNWTVIGWVAGYCVDCSRAVGCRRWNNGPRCNGREL